MDRGSLVSGRFRLEGCKASGGMGDIHLALDLQTSEKVALKVLRWHDATADARFAREATVLAELQHPGIVRYVAQGQTAQGDAYLAMEWLDGELLSERLRRGPLGINDSIGLVARVAEALAMAHEHGIVHRDVKPSNLLCESGRLDRVKLLDFGLARTATLRGGVTRSGELAGTPGYMAPEQVRGLHDVDARADVYSLGCVLYECLTGHPVYSGEHVFAVLAKILVEEPPRASELRAEVPPALDALLGRLLDKDPSQRPDDAGHLLAELRALAPELAEVAKLPAPVRAAKRGLGRGEQHVMCVILAAHRARRMDEIKMAECATIQEQDHQTHKAIFEAVRSFGGQLERIAGGAMIVTLGGAGSATDLVARAARCSLSIGTMVPDMQVALATGRGRASERLPVGEAIDEAASLIARIGSDLPGLTSIHVAPETRTTLANAPRLPASSPVRLDEVTAGLLDPRFELGVTDGGILLCGFSEHREGERTLLGRPTPFVGRERELATLTGLFAECVAEPVAHAVLITAPAGVGKSRLRGELVKRVRDSEPGVKVWIGRGDPMSAGAPLALLAQMIRREANLQRGEPGRTSRRKLHARLGRYLTGADVDRVAEFVGEMCGVPFSDENSPLLRLARRDASIMGDELRRAWEELLVAECADGPVILVLEDLHWGDLPTVKFVEASLRTLARRPLMVLALARPEVHERFPDLWAERDLQRLALRPLTERAARQLAEDTLGEAATPTLVQRLVDQAAGNAFYLEELIRGASNGEQNPGTVLAMIGARLDGLRAEQRRILRAASVLGDSFWPGALRMLVDADDAALATSLAQLVEKEWLVQGSVSRRADEPEYSFRHCLLREAAYAMLTAEDRQLGHRLAGEWLERSGETDAMTLGEHFERGGEPIRAGAWYARAAQQALGGGDVHAAIERARRGLACSASSRTTVVAGPGSSPELGALLAEAYAYSSDPAEAEADGLGALDLLPASSPTYFAAVAQLAGASTHVSHHDRVRRLAERLLHVEVGAVSAPAFTDAAHITCERILFFEERSRLTGLEAPTEELAAQVTLAHPTPPARAQIVRAMVNGSDRAEALALMSSAADALDALGDRRCAAVARHDVGFAYVQLGLWERAETELAGVAELAVQLGMPRLRLAAQQHLAMVLAHRGELAEAERLLRTIVCELAARADRRHEAQAHLRLALVLLSAGILEEAEKEARLGAASEDAPLSSRAEALSRLAEVLLRRGRVTDARHAAGAAMDLLARAGGGTPEGELALRLTWAETLFAAGDIDGARVAITIARELVLAMAERIRDAGLRASFLERVPENARVLHLAGHWLEGQSR